MKKELSTRLLIIGCLIILLFLAGTFLYKLNMANTSDSTMYSGATLVMDEQCRSYI